MSLVSRSKLTIRLVVVGCLLGGSAAQGEEWKLHEQTEDGISVYVRRRADSRVHEVRGVCSIPASPQRVFEAAMREETYAEQREHTLSYRVQHTKRDDVWLVYQMVRYPLVARRDLMLRYQSETDPAKQTYRISWRTTSLEAPPIPEEVVRVEVCSGMLSIAPEQGGAASKLVYVNHIDPGGSIPRWMVNLISRREVPTLVRAIRRAAVKQPEGEAPPESP